MGGRGAGYNPPTGNSKERYSKNSVGTRVFDTVKGALGEKGKSIDMNKAYQDANPNYNPRGYDEYTKNCQRCVVAYELRRRGYDVTAQPTYKGDTLPQVVRIDNEGRKWGKWQGAFRHARPESVKAKTSDGVVKNIQDKMRGWGDGSRAVVSITYRNPATGRKLRQGHVFNVEQRKGTTYFVDAQDGSRIHAKEFFEITDRSTVTITRTDNLRISDRAKYFVTSENSYKRRR